MKRYIYVVTDGVYTDHHCRSMMMTRLHATHIHRYHYILSFLFIFNFMLEYNAYVKWKGLKCFAENLFKTLQLTTFH